MKMNGAYMLGQRSYGGKIATVAAFAGLALVYAIPKTRKACNRWLGALADGVIGRVGQMSRSRNDGHRTKSWEYDLARSEKLKGPVKNRKDTATIKVPWAGTTAWKDEWSSE